MKTKEKEYQKPLAKGTEVWVPYSEVEIQYASKAVRNAAVREGNVYYVPGFVAGDTDEKGLSIIFIDDTSKCILSCRNSTQKVRKMIRRRKYLDLRELNIALIESKGGDTSRWEDCQGLAHCQYS